MTGITWNYYFLTGFSIIGDTTICNTYHAIYHFKITSLMWSSIMKSSWIHPKKKQDNTCCNRHFHSRTPGSCLVFPSPACRFPLLSRDPQDPQLSSGSRSIFLQVHHHLGQVFQHLLHLTSSNGWSATRDPFWTFIQRKEQEIKIDQRSKDVQRLQSFFIAI